MASALVFETSVTNNSPSQDSSHPDDHFQSRDYSSSFIMNPVVIVITVVLLILFHHFLITTLSIFAFPFFFLPFVLFFFVLFFNFSSGKWFMMRSCQIKTTESFIVRQPPIQRERTLSNNEVHLQKRESGYL